MNKKRFGLFSTIILSVILILGACSSDSKDATDEKTISVWTMSDGLDEFVKEYEDESGMKVKVQEIPWSNIHDRLLTAVASGNGPDVLQIGTTMVAEFAEAGAFFDLKDYVDDYSNFSPDNYFDAAVETTQYDGQTIGIPWYVDTRVLFYRTDILGEVGYPEGPETWDDMVDASRQLAARGDDQYAIDLPLDDENIFFPIVWEQGWDYEVDKGSKNFEDPEFRKAIELYQIYYGEKLSQIEEGKESVQAFSDGSKPMFISGPWDIGVIKDKAPEIEGQWAVRLMPEAEDNTSMMGGAHLTVFHNTEKVEQALEFINWMTEPEKQLAWYQAKSELPANMGTWEDPILSDDQMVNTFGEQLKSTKALPIISEFSKISSELADTLEQIIRGGKDIDSELEEYQEKVSEILSE